MAGSVRWSEALIRCSFSLLTEARDAAAGNGPEPEGRR